MSRELSARRVPAPTVTGRAGRVLPSSDRMTHMTDATLTTPPPSGTGCIDCDELGGWWVHLRRCVECGHVGCCDTSPAQHATAHFRETGHPIIRSFEPGEDWYWDYTTNDAAETVPVPPPLARPEEQPVPGPADRVPDDWRSLIHR